MPTPPSPLRTLDLLFSASMLAHEAIFDMRRELIEVGRGTAEVDALLAESARITLNDLRNAAADGRRLAAQWDEQSLLDPAAADLTLPKLASEVARAESRIRKMLDRQRKIAARLRTLLDE